MIYIIRQEPFLRGTNPLVHSAGLQDCAEDVEFEEIKEETKNNDYELDKEMVDVLP